MSDPDQNPETSSDASLGRLFGLLKDFVLRYRWLVVLVLVLGVLNAGLQKGPLLLIKGVVDTLFQVDGGRGVGAGGPSIYDKIDEWKDLLLGWMDLGGMAAADAGPVERVAGYLVLLAMLAPLGALAMYFYRYLANFLSTKIIVDLRETLTRHILTLSLGFFARFRSGDLISRITNDTNSVRASFTLVLENIVVEPLLLLINVGIAWSVHPFLALVVLVTIPILMIPMRGLGRKVRKSSGKSLEALGSSTDVMSQMFQGFRTVKAFQLEGQEMQEFEEENDRFFRRTMKLVRAKAFSQSLTFFIYMIGFGVILLILARFSSDLEPGDVVMAIIPLSTTYQHVKCLVRSYNLVKESQGALDRLTEILDQKAHIQDEGDAEALDDLDGEIQFEKVSFSYEDEEGLVLNELDFRVRPGEKIALVGPSGGGKSTVLNLLARFYDPKEGRVLVDGKDLKTLRLSSYLSHVATVDQSPFLFNRSIRENILLGKPGASEEEMLEAARIANVDSFVEALPLRFDAVVGERGASLSGGQLQRITIARAVIRDPRILLLDEATSALDTESERVVQEALDNLMRGRTSFIIAHRLSTIRGADRILVLEEGRLVEEGSHEDLMENEDGIYHRLKVQQT